jgi:hypothetical protein
MNSPRSLDLVLAAACLALLSNVPTVKAQTAPSGALEVPAKTIPVPTTVSPQLQKIIGAPLRSNWDIHPKTGEEWKPVADAGAAALVKNVPGLHRYPRNHRAGEPQPATHPHAWRLLRSQPR